MINTTGATRVFINGRDYSQYVVEGSISEDSAYSTNVITRRGSLKLAGSDSILDFDKTLFQQGSSVNIYSQLPNLSMSKLPTGNLLVLNSIINLNEPSITLELGCTLNYLTQHEESFEGKIEELITTLIPSHIRESFSITNFDVSTLQTLLDIAGKVIFQNSNGSIVAVSCFGSDGIGSSGSSKLTSFDKYTAIDLNTLGGSIEDIPSSIIVTASVEVPAGPMADVPEEEEEEEEDEEEEEEDEEDGFTEEGKPPEFTLSHTTRTISIPSFLVKDSDFKLKNIPESPEAQSEALPNCGTASNPVSSTDPDAEDFSPYGFTVTGTVESAQQQVIEQVTTCSHSSFNGPGNQVDIEYDFEYTTAATYASGVFNGVIEKYVELIEKEKEEVKVMCAKLNPALTLRDEYNAKPITILYGGGRTEPFISDEDKAIQNAQKYYGCTSEKYLGAAEFIAIGCENLLRKGTNLIDEFINKYQGYSAFNVTTYHYNPDGSVYLKKTLNYIHPASTQEAERSMRTAGAKYTNRSVPVAAGNLVTARAFMPQRQAQGELDFGSYSPMRNQFSDLIDGHTLLTEHDPNIIKNIENQLKLYLTSSTVVSYKYTNNIVTETTKFIDFQNQGNNFAKISFSSTGSTTAAEPNRIEILRDVDGTIIESDLGLDSNDDSDNEEFLQDDEQSMKTEELSYEQKVSKSQPKNSLVWLGTPRPQPKQIQLPMQFAPISYRKRSSGYVKPNVTRVLSRYQKIISNYALIAAKKIVADNSGFRIVESGHRAELFGYYPYFPITLDLASLGKRYRLRAAASNWVFDSDNIICSIDCFNVGTISSIATPAEISPSIYPAFTTTETNVVLDLNFFNLPATAVSIKIATLPTNGTISLNGNSISIDDIITTTQISSNLLSFILAGLGTTEISFTYKALDASGNEISSIDNIFPPAQILYVEDLFADGGEFTDNTSNSGVDAGGGDLDAGLRPGGGYHLNGGDFDTGAEIFSLEPEGPVTPAIDETIDPETDIGTTVVDNDGTVIDVDTLPAPSGHVDSLVEIDVDFTIKTRASLSFRVAISRQLGWNYGSIFAGLGTAADLGTIVSPSTLNLDFGSIANPNEPALTSSVT